MESPNQNYVWPLRGRPGQDLLHSPGSNLHCAFGHILESLRVDMKYQRTTRSLVVNGKGRGNQSATLLPGDNKLWTWIENWKSKRNIRNSNSVEIQQAHKNLIERNTMTTLAGEFSSSTPKIYAKGAGRPIRPRAVIRTFGTMTQCTACTDEKDGQDRAKNKNRLYLTSMASGPDDIFGFLDENEDQVFECNTLFLFTGEG